MIIHVFGMKNAQVVSTPLENHFRLFTTLCLMTKVDVASCLVYALVYMRSNIPHAVGLLSRFVNNQGEGAL